MFRKLALSLYVAIVTLTPSGLAFGQTAPPYLRTISTQPYAAVTGGTPVPLNSRDDGEGLVPIGFDFTYFGQVFSHITVGSNGAMSMSAACTSNADCDGGSCAAAGFCLADIGLSAPNPSFPSTSVPNGMIGGVWDDLNLSSRGDVTTQVVGTTPNREFVIQYEAAPHYDFTQPDSSSQTAVNFQVRLGEADGAVRIHYGPYNAIPAENGVWSWANGVENGDGTDGSVGVPCASNSSCDGTELTSRVNTVITWAPPTGAELVAEGVAPTGSQPGGTVLFDITARNVGTTTATGTFFVDVHLSAGPTVTSTDTRLGRLSFTDLPSLSAQTLPLTATIPGMLAPGRYTLGAIIDPTNVVSEVLENNNVTILNPSFLVGDELSVEVDLPPDTGPGEAADFTVRILNEGSAQAAVNAQVFLSVDQTLDAQDFQVVSATVAVPAQPVTSLTVTATIPNIQPGDYWVIAVVDPANAIPEVDETNNTFVTDARMFLDGPDLVADAVGSPSMFAFRGQPLDVTGTIANEGGGRAVGFRYGFYLSSNPLCSAVSDVLLADIGPQTLAPLTDLDIQRPVPVPSTTPVGDGYLCLIVNSDNAVLEQSTRNNIRRTNAPLIVRDPGADFVAPLVQVSPAGAAGESLLVSRTIRNLGNATDSADYRVYLSTDGTVDPAQDVLLGSGRVDLAPDGVSRDVDSVLVPASTAPGTYSVIYVLDPDDRVDELFEGNNLGVSTASVAISPAGVTIATQALPTGVVGEAYDVTVSATGGVGAFTWSVEQGSLPMGLTLEPTTGRIQGVPEQAGASDVVLSARAGSLTAARAFVLLIADPSAPLEVLTRAVPLGFAEQDYAYDLVAFGGVPPYQWSLALGTTLPVGFALGEDGRIEGRSGSATLGGFTARVTDALGGTADRELVLRVIAPRDAVRIADEVLPDGRVDEAYEETIRAETDTGEAPYVFEVADGAPPAGLTLAADGTLSGTPIQVGVSSFSVRLTDARGDFDLNRFVVEIAEGGGVTFITNALPRGLLDAPYLDEESPVRILATSDTGTVSLSIVQGDLPPGLSFDGETVSGTPTSQGTYSFVVLARDGAGQQDLRAYGIVIDEPVIVPPEPPVEDGCRCVAGPEGGSNGFGWLVLALGGVMLLRRRRGALLVALLTIAPSVASAQTPYFVDSRTETYVPRTGGNALTFSSNDDGDAQVILPFAFRYFETDYTSIYVGTNCLVRFGDRATSRFNTVMPSTEEIENQIALFWDDCINPTVTTHVEGTAPARVFIIQYTSTEHFDGPTGGQLAYQLHLHEGAAARFEVFYGPVTGMTDASLWTASSGYEDPTGTRGGPLLPCNGACTGTDFRAAENTVVRVQQDAGIEVTAVGVTDIPNLVYTGVPFDVTVRMGSLHTNPVGPFTYEVHLLAPGETVPNRPIYTSAPVTLTPFQQLETSVRPTVPLQTAPARYRLALVVDSADQLVESDEDNNVAISNVSFDLAAPQPDFLPVAVVPSATVAAAGDTLDAEVFVRNRGNLAGSTAWRLVLSRNPVISVEDLELDRGIVTLDLLTTATVSVQVSLPAELDSGDYVLGLIVDPDDDVTEIDELNNIARGSDLRITSNQLSVRTTGLPGGYVGLGYTHFLRADGGDGAYTWSLDTGALPAGLTLDAATGEIDGIPTAVEQAQVTVAVESDGERATADLTLDVVVAEGGLTIVTRSLLPGAVGGAYPPVEPGTPENQHPRIVAVGAQGEVRFSLDGPTPPGLELAEDGRVFGSPRQAGVFLLDVVAQDDVAEARRAVALTVFEPGRLTLVGEPLPDATLGQAYAYDFRVVGTTATGTVTFQASSGLPPGLIVSTAGAMLGSPEQVGTFAFTVRAVEGTGSAAPSDSFGFRLVVQDDGGFEITPTSLPAATVGEAYEQELGTRNGETPLSWRVLGPSLPPGLEYEIVDSGSLGQVLRFRGVATEAGTATLLVRATDALGRQAQASLTIDAREPPPEPPVVVEPSGCVTVRPEAEGAGLAVLLIGMLVVRRRRRR